jgi:hypothetical protein
VSLDHTISLENLDQTGLRKAQDHFVRACELDPKNVEANYFLNLVRALRLSSDIVLKLY